MGGVLLRFIRLNLLIVDQTLILRGNGRLA
jgi:hypothetical protein